MVGFGFDAYILSDAANQPPLILTTQGTLPPNAFGPVITFDSTFTYQGGDLLLEYTHTLPEAVNDGDEIASWE